jgi:hypothetical protein
VLPRIQKGEIKMSRTVFVKYDPWLDVDFVKEELDRTDKKIKSPSCDFDQKAILRGERIILEFLYKALKNQRKEE